ncbi:YCII-related protein [Gemmatirosa kalamazoonensis]|uniref:YCII-related protein n=1 Tax=Gemmatirosa kalamazoonensis TaxID=861299 RepID=W0RCN7_9BACT|nr:YciI family protein [Gemmatirosa kalamazoonensis]AHG88182.1 YCII-related protein [Gemmatirosa kalamazoonensis]
MSQFVFLYRSTPEGQQEALGTPERAQRSLQAYMAWIHELEAGGHLAARGQPLERTGAVVRGSAVIDGPYVEAKDIVLGFIVVEATDLAQATELAARCPIAQGGGSVEVRPVMPLAM